MSRYRELKALCETELARHRGKTYWDPVEQGSVSHDFAWGFMECVRALGGVPLTDDVAAKLQLDKLPKS